MVRSGFETGPYNVVRRYSDFSWLSSELAKEFPGAIIPPLPDKQAVGRFSSEFIETRRRALERFIIRVVAHAELGSSKHLVAFLQYDENAFTRAKDDSKANKSNIGSSAMAWLEGTVNTMSVGKVSFIQLHVKNVVTSLSPLSMYIARTRKICRRRQSRRNCSVYFPIR